MIVNYTGGSTLTIANATTTDAGKYSCKALSNGTTDARSVVLTIIGKLQCVLSVSSFIAILTCQIITFLVVLQG